MRALSLRLTEDFRNILMRHLVLEHFDKLPPAYGKQTRR